jgi:RimJ/RimL family protein N-acetyltransferase
MVESMHAAFAGAVALVGSHVVLEPLARRHSTELGRIGLDPDLWRWTTTELRTREDMLRYVRHALRLQRAGAALPFAIRERTSGGLVGSTRFGNIDRDNRRAEIGWTWIARPWQRTVINTECKYLMLRHAFETAGCIRVEFKTDVLNERSRAALRRIGAIEEGVLRSHMITSSGRVRDTVYFSILVAEWPRVKEALEARLASAPSA